MRTGAMKLFWQLSSKTCESERLCHVSDFVLHCIMMSVAELSRRRVEVQGGLVLKCYGAPFRCYEAGPHVELIDVFPHCNMVSVG